MILPLGQISKRPSVAFFDEPDRSASLSLFDRLTIWSTAKRKMSPEQIKEFTKRLRLDRQPDEP